MSDETRHSADYDAPGTGPFYAYDNPTIERADLHGCLDEDVETGDPIVCAECSNRPGLPAHPTGTPAGDEGVSGDEQD